MIDLKKFEIWFVTGSQHLYGEETLRQVDEHSTIIAGSLNDSPAIPVRVVFKPVVKTPEEIYAICQEANVAPNCVGIVAWMHTFSPAKMWIRGLNCLKKPLLHFHTQFNRDIPFSTIDMDFMNLNQSAHGDREFGFIGARMGIARKAVVGHWQDPEVHERINVWSRVASGWNDLQGAKFARFGDNMRFVSALIVPSFAKLKEWTKQHGIQFTSNEEIIKNSMVLALYEDAVSEYNLLFNQVEQVKKFTLMPREWGIAYDEMTPKMSIKRKVILSHFEKEIEAMYV